MTMCSWFLLQSIGAEALATLLSWRKVSDHDRRPRVEGDVTHTCSPVNVPQQIRAARNSSPVMRTRIGLARRLRDPESFVYRVGLTEVEIRPIQQMLGHSDIRTTPRYLNITDEALRNSTLTGPKPTRRSETRVQLGLDPGHPAAKEILQQCDLGGVGVVSRRELRPAPEVATRGVTDLGRHRIDDAVEVVGREFPVQQRLEALPVS